MFLCRDDELDKLNRRYARGRFECVIVYGRRRVGKTTLISEFCKDKPAIFFPALRSSASDNLEALSKAIYALDRPDATDAPVYPSFDAAFDAISALARRGRIVFVIDEYPYLARADASISSRLQHLIDHVWKDTQLYLILCGSSMSFMEQQVLGYESPLYGRRTAQFRIDPLTYRDAACFNPDLSPADNALVYGVVGGVPHYLNLLDIHGDVDAAILENVFEPSCYLYEEPENLLKQELREPALYNAIIKAIAQGASRLNDIAQKAGLPTAQCSQYLAQLMSLGLLMKETPVTEKPGRKTIYRLCDNFFRFRYRFVETNLSAIASGRIRRNYPVTVKPFYPDYMGAVFEDMCRQYLLYYADDLPIEIRDVGRWWGTHPTAHKAIEIDIVATAPDDSAYLIGSCKYRNEKIGVDELELLRDYAAAMSGGRECHYFIFSKSGFTKGLQDAARAGDVRLVTLDELYKT